MAGMTPDQVAQAWVAGLSGKTSKMTAGAQAVTVAPGQAAARQAQVWLANTQAAAARWQSRVAAVSLSDWQTAYVNKGVPRIASGAQAAQGKFAQVMTTLLPHIERVRAGLPPRGTVDQNIQRAVAMMQGMHQFRAGGQR